MKEQDSKTSLGLFALLAAMAITLAFLIVELTALRELPTKISCIISAVICLIALYYGIRGYKVPHGNTIRYLLLAFAVAEASEFLFNPGMIKPMAVCLLLTTILSSYMAGRLNKSKECKIIIALVGILLIAVWAMHRFMPPAIPMGQPGPAEMDMAQIPERTDWIRDIFPSDISRFLSWLVLGVSYITRYDGHKKAGIESSK